MRVTAITVFCCCHQVFSCVFTLHPNRLSYSMCPCCSLNPELYSSVLTNIRYLWKCYLLKSSLKHTQGCINAVHISDTWSSLVIGSTVQSTSRKYLYQHFLTDVRVGERLWSWIKEIKETHTTRSSTTVSSVTVGRSIRPSVFQMLSDATSQDTSCLAAERKQYFLSAALCPKGYI